MVIKLDYISFVWLANFSFLDNFALKKDTFYQYKHLFIKILELWADYFAYLTQFLKYFTKILLTIGWNWYYKGFVI